MHDMNRLSIVIPFLDPSGSSDKLVRQSSAAFEDTLASVLRHQPDASEVFVLSHGNYDDPHDVEFEGVKFIECDPSVHWTNGLIQASTQLDGDVVHILRPGTSVDEGWCDDVVDQFDSHDVACVAPRIVSEQNPSKVVTLGVSASTSYRPVSIKDTKALAEVVGPSSWGGFYRRESLERLAESNWQFPTDSFDLALGLCFQKLGMRVQTNDDCLIYMEQPSDVLTEFKKISGRTAQELQCCYGGKSNLPGKLSTSLTVFKESILGYGLANAKTRFQISTRKCRRQFESDFEELADRWQKLDDYLAPPATETRRAA